MTNNVEQNPSISQPLRILVIEDNQVDRRMLESMLLESSTPHNFLKTASNLNSALKLLDEYQFDVAVLDLNLPDSIGEVSLAKIHEKSPNLAVVVNTGAYEDDLGLKTLGMGAQDFLVKGKYSAYTINKVLRYSIERKRLETELHQTYEKLKETQFELIQVEKMKVIGSLASGVAHEVKNPLATILYGVTFLIEKIKSDDEKINLALTNIREATLRANNIITDLLDFSNLSKLTKKPENLNTTIESALNLISHEFDKNHVQLIKNFDPYLVSVNYDRNRIEQVLINLMLNAIHAMPAGGNLKIQTSIIKLSDNFEELPRLNKTRYKGGQSVAVIRIDDTGCGIPDDKIDKVFDPFFTTKRAQGGVGLGLTVSQNIMELHEADLFLENNPLGGTRATLVFKI